MLQWHVRLADFGFAVFLAPGEKTSDVAGSRLYEAPELIRFEPFDFKADIWSLGVVLYAMLSGCLPFRGRDDDELGRRIVEGRLNLTSKPWPSVPGDAKRLVARMLQYCGVTCCRWYLGDCGRCSNGASSDSREGRSSHGGTNKSTGKVRETSMTEAGGSEARELELQQAEAASGEVRQGATCCLVSPARAPPELWAVAPAHEAAAAPPPSTAAAAAAAAVMPVERTAGEASAVAALVPSNAAPSPCHATANSQPRTSHALPPPRLCILLLLPLLLLLLLRLLLQFLVLKSERHTRFLPVTRQ
ncbi:hypothetical protein CLOM_g10795 [Closterium sp. NIES-68]|nr:hypothetical protein CLOM_g10795 [Closterium sp. NIES-68]